ncbi:MAG: CBS domain-containing protein [Chloroflexi bacterium]|nr:CBS domain-containing protein [Chloroflexota bacterium]
MLVESIMTRQVVTTEPRRTIQSAAQLMREGRFRHLPVVTNGALTGIISDRDVAARLDGAVSDIMHREVVSISPDTPVEVAAQLMLDNKIGALPVVDPTNEMLVGIVSQTDLFGVLAGLLGGGRAPSSRLELHLQDLPRQLAQLADIAQRRHITITSLVTLPSGDHPNKQTLVLRIGTMQTVAFVDELRQSGIEVARPESGGG